MVKSYSFLPEFFRLAGINILSNLMVPLAGLIDIAFLGHLADIRHLAGVALATVLFNYIYWTFGFLRMGTTGLIAQAVGRNDDAEILIIGLRNSILAIGLGLVILLLQHPLREIGFFFLSATPAVKASAQLFFDALIWGAPATLFNFVVLGWFLGAGKGREVLFLSVIGNGVNIGLDYLLIVRFGWESTGAGTATAASQYLMAIVGVILIGRSLSKLPIERRDLKLLFQEVLNLKALKAVFLLNSDILIRTLALISTFAVFTNISSTFGTNILASNSLLLQIVTLAAYFIDGLAFATESFAGLFYGKGEVGLLSPLVWASGWVSLICGLAIAVVVSVLPIPLFSLLTRHLEVVQIAEEYVLWLLPLIGFASIAYMLDGYFLGLTEGAILRKSTIIAALIGFIPLAFLAWQSQNNHLLWLALTAFMAARSITLCLQLFAKK